MNAALQILGGVLTTVILAALLEVLPAGGLVTIVAVAALALTACFGGARLPLGLKVFATTFIFYFGYAMCLFGRTMEPRWTVSNHWLSYDGVAGKLNGSD